MHKLILPLGIFLLPIVIHAQDTSIIKLDEYVISANKFKENKKNVAQQIQVTDNKEITWIMPQTSAVMLEQTGNVFVQKSQMGGGSPVLRGFEASRVLLVVDGVRMNNAVYRTGHLQNVITVDANILDRTEVLYGPSSTLYGSDALGGVIHFITKQPVFSDNEKLLPKVNALARYSTAYGEFTGHADFNLGVKRFASLTSVTYSSFGDLRQGAGRSPFNKDFGRRNEYVTRINGTDSIVVNKDPNIQKYSGYDQIDLLQKFSFKQKENIIHGLNLQYSTSSDIPRYDRLTDVRNGRLRWAEWYYGPQERLMAAYTFHAFDLKGWFDEVKAGLNYQKIGESRYQRQVGAPELESRIENIDVTGYNIDLRKNSGVHELSIGMEGQYNKVKSNAYTTAVANNETKPLDTRYPDGGSNMMYAALYAQHIYKITPGKFLLNGGLRFNYVSLRSEFKDKTFFPFPYDVAEQKNNALSGNLGIVYLPHHNWRFTLNGSTGFRAPNVDDLGKVFESAGGEQLIVPNPDLKPEYTYNIDAGITFLKNDKIKVEATGFYTWVRNAIVTDRFQLNGSDSILYDGGMAAVVANQNKAHAWLYGYNVGLTAALVKDVVFYSTINYTYGRFYDQANTEVPLDHVPPVYGKTSLRYNPGKLSTEFYVLYNGWKLLKDYNPYGEDNLQYATAEGMPSWYTLNLRAGYEISENFYVETALENILDKNYRAFASGINAPGRNFVISLKGRF